MSNTIIDFLTPEVEIENSSNIIDSETKNHINTEEVNLSNDDEQQTQFDFLNSTEDVENTSTSVNKDTSKEVKQTETQIQTTADYYSKFIELSEKGLIDLDNLPEDISTDPDSPTTAEDTLKAVLHNIEKREAALVNYGEESLLGKLPQELKDAILYAKNEGDPIDYLRMTLESQEIKSLDPSIESHQEKIVREFYKTTDLTSDEINEKISDLRDTDLLKKEADKLKPKLDKRADEIAKSKLESQTAIKSQKEAVNNVAGERITNSLVKGVEGIKFNQQEAVEIFNTLMLEREFDYGTHKATRTGVEYLIDYHKYSKDGSPDKVIKALMILDPKGRFDSKIESLYKKEANKKFIADHVTNSGNKFKGVGVNTNEKQTQSTNSKQTNKFKFI